MELPDLNERRCDTPGCDFNAGHDGHPCAYRLIDGQPCKFCGEPNPCANCWTPITPAMLKGLAAEAGQDVTTR